MIGCTRSSLNVVASEKGVVVGRMKFRDDGDLIDCTKMGVGGKVIPSLIDRVSDISVGVCICVYSIYLHIYILTYLYIGIFVFWHILILAYSAIPGRFTPKTKIYSMLRSGVSNPLALYNYGVWPGILGGCAAFNVPVTKGGYTTNRFMILRGNWFIAGSKKQNIYRAPVFLTILYLKLPLCDTFWNCCVPHRSLFDARFSHCLQGDAQFVLLVEKDAVFMRLSEDRFYNDYPWCVARIWALTYDARFRRLSGISPHFCGIWYSVSVLNFVIWLMRFSC